MSRPSSLESRLSLLELSRLRSLELRDDNDDDPVPEDIVPASTDQLMSMQYDADIGNLDEFEKKFIRFEPTEQMWEMRILANFKAFGVEHTPKRNAKKPTSSLPSLPNPRQFQTCLQVANEMQKNGFQPTTTVINILTQIAKSPQQKIALAEAIQSWSTHATHASDASNGGRPKMRRQIRTRSRHRLNKSKKNRRRKVRRTRHKL